VNARPEIRQRLIEIKMARWCRRAKYKFLDPTCPASRARKNYWRLCARYPQIMQRLGLSEISVYQ
jgi:hypothetical protein